MIPLHLIYWTELDLLRRKEQERDPEKIQVLDSQLAHLRQDLFENPAYRLEHHLEWLRHRLLKPANSCNTCQHHSINFAYEHGEKDLDSLLALIHEYDDEMQWRLAECIRDYGSGSTDEFCARDCSDYASGGLLCPKYCETTFSAHVYDNEKAITRRRLSELGGLPWKLPLSKFKY